jgi:rhodanese-related sulfurtransferase
VTYTAVDRRAVQDLVRGGAQLVDVLPARGYEAQHLPQAVNVPLAELDATTAARLRQGGPVIVYCYDYQ